MAQTRRIQFVCTADMITQAAAAALRWSSGCPGMALARELPAYNAEAGMMPLDADP
jgi:hypothetical protein